MTFFNDTQIEEFSSAAKRGLLQAIETARNADTISVTDRDRLNKRWKVHLLCHLHESRMIWGRWISHHLSTAFGDYPGNVRANKLFLVTLCDIRCVTSIEDRQPPIAGFKKRLGFGLRGLSYLGAIEPAYYTNVQSGARIDGKKCIFWHLHAIVWGISKRDLKERIDDLENSGRYSAITEQFRGAHMKAVKQGQLAKTVGYIFKPPANAYRLSLYDGVSRKLPVTMAKQSQQRLRPGERIRLFHVMKEMSLPDLAVAGGGGMSLLDAIKKAARDESGFTRMKAREYADTKARKQRTRKKPPCK